MNVLKFFKPLDPIGGSRDRYGIWPAGESSYVAFVADAPNAAAQESGRIVELFLGELMESRARAIAQVLESPGDGDGARLLAADLMTGAADALYQKAKGHAYAACVIALASPGQVCIASRGDCGAVVCGAEQAYRVSDTTRLGGFSAVSVPAALPAASSHFQEGVYLGAQPEAYHPRDVTRFSTHGIRFVALFSDGAEKQIGARDLIGLLRDQSNTDALDQLHDGLDRKLNASRPIDDLTLMVAEVPV